MAPGASRTSASTVAALMTEALVKQQSQGPLDATRVDCAGPLAPELDHSRGALMRVPFEARADEIVDSCRSILGMAGSRPISQSTICASLPRSSRRRRFRSRRCPARGLEHRARRRRRSSISAVSRMCRIRPRRCGAHVEGSPPSGQRRFRNVTSLRARTRKQARITCFRSTRICSMRLRARACVPILRAEAAW